MDRPTIRARGHRGVFAAALAAAALLGSCTPRTAAPRLSEAAMPVVSPGWIRLKPAARVAPQDFMTLFARDLHQAEGTQWPVVHEEQDELGISHARLQQRWRGLDVEGAEFLLHSRAGRVFAANGRLARDFAPALSTPAVDEARAWQAARHHVGSERFYDGRRLQQSVESGPDTTAPRGTLLFASKAEGENRWQWVLAWRFDAWVAPLEASRRVYVDAQDGTVLKSQPLMAACFTTNSPTTFRGTQPFNTASRGGGFVLTDDCHGTQLRYRDPNADGTKVVDLLDADNDWRNQDIAKVTSFWALGVTYDYFDLVHGRKGHDGKNAEITIVNKPALGDGANGGGGFINIGLGSTGAPGDDYNTADIVGHEFTHNVIETSAALAYDASKESAALNESFSDIFGVMVDAWEKRNASPSWIIGADKGCLNPAVCRNLINPKQFGNPDTYKGSNWQSVVSIDPHNNGSVQNRWFALAATGGSGVNAENGQVYAINGIGIERARRIAFRTLTRYLSSGSDYAAARDGSIQAAVDLFGDGSAEEAAVTQAWCAVGLCPFPAPAGPDRFDSPGGNPNPLSPDHNDTEAGATPIGLSNWVLVGVRRPTLLIDKLSLFPSGDTDHFRITVPDVGGLGGRCFPKGVSLAFSSPVDASVLIDGRVTQFAHDTVNLRVPASGSFVLRVAAPFPALVLSYSIRATFYEGIDPECWQTEPPTVFERIRQCPMCDQRVLGDLEEIVLDPDWRQPDLVAPQRHLFRFEGGRLELPLRVTEGNTLSAELTDATGRVLDQVRWAGGAAPSLRADQLPAGIYGLRFTAYGNGTRVQVQAPRAP